MVRYPSHYRIAHTLPKICALLGVTTSAVLARAGVSEDLLDPDARGATGAQLLNGWKAVFEETGDPDAPIKLGIALAHAPVLPSSLAFYSSPDVATGFERLSIYKPLVGPVTIDCQLTEDAFILDLATVETECDVPSECSRMETVFFLELIRVCTGQHVKPRAIIMPLSRDHQAALEDFTGCKAISGKRLRMVFAPEVAGLQLLTGNEAYWKLIEKELNAKLAALDLGGSEASRVRRALLDLLPAGKSDVDAIARHLNFSRRTLQRLLKSENTSFQDILSSTRRDLALHYLSRPDITIDEISFLLAYGDPNSFYRAFQQWTGQTPTEARQALLYSAAKAS